MVSTGFDRVLCAMALMLAVFFCVVGMTGTANAQDNEAAHAAMKKSLVYLKASGTGASGPIAGVPMEATGTGFLVSDDGFILTTYHLLSELGDVVPETVKIEASIGRKAIVFELTAAPVNSVPELDLLLLKIPPDDTGYTPVKLGSLADANSASDILTSGFNKPVGHHKDSGSMGSKDTPSGYLWTVNDMPFEKGQSGSPVYTLNGNVIGVAKGQAVDSPSINYMIPIQLADSLLAHLRVAELRDTIGRLNTQNAELTEKLGEIDRKRPIADRLSEVETGISNIQKVYDWNAAMTQDGVLLSFTKILSGGPALTSLEFQITPIITVRKKKSNGEVSLDSADVPVLEPGKISISEDIGSQLSGNILIDKDIKRIKGFRDGYGDSIDTYNLKIAIVPLSKEGEPLNSKILTIPEKIQ
jgi:S1-C subfamily serine protease